MVPGVAGGPSPVSSELIHHMLAVHAHTEGGAVQRMWSVPAARTSRGTTPKRKAETVKMWLRKVSVGCIFSLTLRFTLSADYGFPIK